MSVSLRSLWQSLSNGTAGWPASVRNTRPLPWHCHVRHNSKRFCLLADVIVKPVSELIQTDLLKSLRNKHTKTKCLKTIKYLSHKEKTKAASILSSNTWWTSASEHYVETRACLCLYIYTHTHKTNQLTKRIYSEHLVVSRKNEMRWNIHPQADLEAFQ